MGNKIKIRVEIDSNSLEADLEKANRLKASLKEIKQLLASIAAKVLLTAKRPDDGMLFTDRRLQNTGKDPESPVCDADQILEELSKKLKEWTDRTID